MVELIWKQDKMAAILFLDNWKTELQNIWYLLIE